MSKQKLRIEVPDYILINMPSHPMDLYPAIARYLREHGLTEPFREVQDLSRAGRVFEGIPNPCFTEDTEWP